MKTILSVLLLSICSVFALQAQDNGEPKGPKPFDIEKFNAQKTTYLIQQVGITPEEAALLLPLYNEMQTKRFQLMMATRTKARELRKGQNKKDEDYVRLLDEILDKQIEEANLEKSYYRRFKQILSPEKLFKFKLADMHFAREVLKRADQRRGTVPPPPPAK